MPQTDEIVIDEAKREPGRVEIKFAAEDVQEDGTFSGYGAVFGNLDSYRDVIAKGAFTKSLREWRKAKRMPPMLLQHGGWGMGSMDEVPVGKWLSIEEDDTGLKVEGKLISLDTERGRTVYGAMKEGVMTGMSIGYRARKYQIGTKPDEPNRTLTEVDIVEISVVTSPANDLARVASIKSRIDTIRQFETFLRDAGGFSQQAAKAIAADGFKAFNPRDEEDADQLADLIRRNIQTINPR